MHQYLQYKLKELEIMILDFKIVILNHDLFFILIIVPSIEKTLRILFIGESFV